MKQVLPRHGDTEKLLKIPGVVGVGEGVVYVVSREAAEKVMLSYGLRKVKIIVLEDEPRMLGSEDK